VHYEIYGYTLTSYFFAGFKKPATASNFTVQSARIILIICVRNKLKRQSCRIKLK